MAKEITAEDVALWKQEYESGDSLRKIGERHDVDKTTVKYHLKGVVKFREKSPNKKYADEWYQLWKDGWSKADIARKYKVTTNIVSNILSKEKGVVKKRTGRRRFEHLLPVFKEMYEAGYDLTDISKKTGASRQTVLNYLNDDGVKIRTYSEVNRVHAVQEDYFDVIDSDRKAYMLGLVFSSGTLLEHHSSKSLQLTVAKDRKHVIEEVFRELTDKKLTDILFIEEKGQYVDRIFSKHMYGSLKRLGMGVRDEAVFPDFTGSYRAEFLRGYLVGRVVIEENRNNVMVASNPNSVEKLRAMLVQVIGVEPDAVKGYLGLENGISVYRNREVEKIKRFIKATD